MFSTSELSVLFQLSFSTLRQLCGCSDVYALNTIIMAALFPKVALDLLRFLETVTNSENPFCVDGRKKNGAGRGKGETMMALVSHIVADAGNKGFKGLTVSKIEGLVKIVLEEVPDKINADTMERNESHFVNIFDAMSVKSCVNKKNKNKTEIATLIENEKDAFNRDASHMIGSIALEREAFLDLSAKDGLATAQKRADRATAGEIIISVADRSAVDDEVR
jgi:hypothetical protein